MFRNVLGKTFRFLGYTVQYGCIAHCAFEYLGGIVVCSGPSMEPTIQNSDIVFSENLSRHFYCIRKGDIVIVKSPNDPKSNICKRVIGLEGDKVCTSNPSDFLKSHSYSLFDHYLCSASCGDIKLCTVVLSLKVVILPSYHLIVIISVRTNLCFHLSCR
uniref:Mitochondrial inner membrane protease subunit n=1 Tax=Dromaius novaehollandiae TaxID=8790 RepID=A0A8C4K0S5_DRONO